MAAQIAELLDAARLRAGQPLDLVRRPTDLVELAYRVAAQAQATADRHAIEVAPEVPELVGEWDAARLERVLGNLLNNAVKYSSGGEVTVRVWREERDGAPWACLAVTDRGLGIPAADRERIFAPYQRATNVEGRVPGTGLGLFGSKQIVEQHGGTIGVESVDGKGAMFFVDLPLAVVSGQ